MFRTILRRNVRHALPGEGRRQERKRVGKCEEVLPLVVLALLTLLTITTPTAGGATGNQEQQSRPPQPSSTPNPVGGSGAADAKEGGRNSSGIVLNSEGDYRLGP